MRAWADVAELTNTKNLNGGLVVRCTPGLSFVLEEGMEVALVPPVLAAPRFVTVEAVQPSGLDGGVVWFREIESVSIAEMVVGCHCLVSRDVLPQHTVMIDDALDVEGWPVRDMRAGSLGAVLCIREMPGQLMLVVERPDGSELLIPLVDEFLVQVDEEEGRLIVDLPSGLLDL